MKLILSCVTALAVLAIEAGPSFAQNNQWGTIKGQITWGAKAIPPAAVQKLDPANANTPPCLAANKGQAPPDETWIVNPKNLGIKNTFVWLVPTDKKPIAIHPNLQAIPAKPIEIDQPACHFIPHALALREGQVLLVKNSANFPHNFKYSGSPDKANNSGNTLIPPAGAFTLKLDADRLPIKTECSIHPWMNGWVRVFTHPYFAVTDDDGNFEIKDAPAGDFRLMIWHGSAGWAGGAKGKNGTPVNIKAGAVNNLGALPSFP